jgi:hypothetical protein
VGCRDRENAPLCSKRKVFGGVGLFRGWQYAKDNLISELQCGMSFELGALANQKVY